jgi:hypothetical protein
MDIVPRALALPIPLPADYVRSLPRIPKDFKVPKDDKEMGKFIPIIILLVLCCLCCMSMISAGFGGYRWWQSSKYRPQTKTYSRHPRAKNV